MHLLARSFTPFILAFAAPVTIISASSATETMSRPNVIIIVGDDMGYADLGVQGCHDIPTPHIDSLAAAGTRCTNGYVSAPYCSPSRAGMLTGRYQTRFGHEFNPVSENDGLPLSETTIADRLKASGYHTGWVGKWHLGGTPDRIPLHRGFQDSYGFLGGAHGYFPGVKPPMLRDNNPVDEKEYLTDAFGREAVSYIDRHAEVPFFLYLAFNAVHTPMNATEDRLEKFKNIKNESRRTYAGMMSAMDDSIGRVLEELQKKHLTENTLVFFFSDNGGPTMKGTTINASRNDPLRGSKRTTLEGGIRVPFIVRWPGHVPAGKVFDEPVISLDIVPTILAATGVMPTANATLDGVNLLPYLNGENNDKPHDTLYWRFGQQMAIRQGDWKLVRYDPVADGEIGKVTAPKLYNLKHDIGESHDLFKSEPEKAKALQLAWDEWNQLNVKPLWGQTFGGARKNNKNAKGKRSQASLERAAREIEAAE